MDTIGNTSRKGVDTIEATSRNAPPTNLVTSEATSEDVAHTGVTSESIGDATPTMKQEPKQGQQLCNMKILNVNFQSLKNKKEELAVLIESTEPSIIIGTETWLNSSVYTSEIFPPNYNVVRKDRQDGYGGVLIAVRRDLVYNIIKNKKVVLWIGGDFNLPDINWEDLSVSGHSNPVPLNNRFLDMIENCNMQQMVSSPAHGDSTLDLFLTNRPTLINKCTLLPGLGDHDIVSIDSDVSAKRCKPVKKKIYLWKKANLSDMKRDCRLFQQDFLIKYCEQSSGDVPEDWKKAAVVPIFKKGERCKAVNYRPVSFTSIVCKTLEHIVCSNILDHLDNHQILSETQHGFRKRRSCTSQLLHTIHDLSNSIDSRNQIDMILLELSKAFDMIPQGRLLHKIQFYGIRGNTHNWIKEFLTDRSQRVVLDGCTSHTSSVPSGVPQGSVIGPLLFLLYINDLLDRVSSESLVRLFVMTAARVYRNVASKEDADCLQKD
ncbi:uncharacterized protein [Diadema antillarum]|uniref:uncharacterized protein n=1 Tax=Diadema antillarum TaxID=105358 RepID=UPI003A842960